MLLLLLLLLLFMMMMLLLFMTMMLLFFVLVLSQKHFIKVWSKSGLLSMKYCYCCCCYYYYCCCCDNNYFVFQIPGFVVLQSHVSFQALWVCWSIGLLWSPGINSKGFVCSYMVKEFWFYLRKVCCFVSQPVKVSATCPTVLQYCRVGV